MKSIFMLDDRYVFQHCEGAIAVRVFCGLESIYHGVWNNGLWCCSPMSPGMGFIRIHGEHVFGELQADLAAYGTLKRSTHTKAGQSWCGRGSDSADEPSSFGFKAP